MTLGIFATKTDISKQEFGEGSFDKGFYFHMPIEIFYDQYSRGVTGFGLRPVTRDGGQFMYHGFNLWSVTDQSQVNNLIRDWRQSMIKYVVLIISFILVSCSTLPPVAYLDVIESSYRAIAGYPDKKIMESFYKEQKYTLQKQG